MSGIIDKENIKKILLINLGGIGDLLLSIPALRALDNLYPRAQISLLTLKRIEEIAKDLEYIDDLVTFDLQNGLGIIASFSQAKRFYQLLLCLRKKKIDMVINMRTLHSLSGALKMALIFYMLNARYRVGRDTCGRGFFLNIKYPEKIIGDLHEIDYNLKLIQILGAEIRDKSLNLKVNQSDIEYIELFLKDNGIEAKDLVIGVHPGADWLSRCWPLENFALVIKGLLSKYNCRVVITGSKAELDLSLRLEQMVTSDRISIATGKTTIRQFVALIKRFNLFITNGTGSMHMATIEKIPMVVIFGPGDITRFKPCYGDKQDRLKILQKDFRCVPCNRRKCRNLICLKSISIDEVLEAVTGLLEKS